MYSNNWKYNQRSLFTTNEKFQLPSFQWQQKTEVINDFNNGLIKGFSQGLSIRNPEEDLKLFNNLDLEPIRSDNINFDKVNAITQEGYSKNDDIYNNIRSGISGVIDQVNKSSNDTLDNIKNMFNIDTSNLKIYFGILIAFLIINK